MEHDSTPGPVAPWLLPAAGLGLTVWALALDARWAGSEADWVARSLVALCFLVGAAILVRAPHAGDGETPADAAPEERPKRDGDRRFTGRSAHAHPTGRISR